MTKTLLLLKSVPQNDFRCGQTNQHKLLLEWLILPVLLTSFCFVYFLSSKVLKHFNVIRFLYVSMANTILV